MRTSQWLISTLKESPREAEVISHQLMLRAGMIKKLASGLYSWLPLGLKVLRKVEKIVREEMNKAGAIEVFMPAIQPAELWQETGRWDTFGGQLLTMKDSHQREYCFGPTHEEVITDILRQTLHSYKQLPINLYQIQTKFRDEIRPRFGVMRAREFTMKDAYSFHLSAESLQQTYDTMYHAYGAIFERLGLRYRAVQADTGSIGGAVSHEFQVLAESGEDEIFYSDQSAYAANAELATSLCPQQTPEPIDAELQLTHTPDIKTIDALTAYLGINASETIKTLLVEGEQYPLVALVLRGDDTLNEIKAAKHPLVKSPLRFATDEEIKNTLNAPTGFVGPVYLDMPIIVDHVALAMPSFVCGANQANHHYMHATWGRDAQYQDTYDLRTVKVGDPSPDGQGSLLSCRGIEVGHIFQVGDKYSVAMDATLLDEHGKPRPMIMGCYGIGISRIVAATIEQHHDERGILWPTNLAPFQLVIIPIAGNRFENVKLTAERLYQEAMALGIEVLLEDRQERPGVLFADHDLIGIPHRLVVSERLLSTGVLEYKPRSADEAKTFSLDEYTTFLNGLL